MKLGRTGTGLASCEEALQRLIEGKSYLKEHVDLDLSRITASIVSLEAGFDRGYLKKSRRAHLQILAKIEKCRLDAQKKSGLSGKTIASVEKKVLLLSNELKVVTSQRDRALSQNIKLWQRVRELESL